MTDTKQNPKCSPQNDILMCRQSVEDRFGIPKRFLELAVARKNGPRIVRIGRLVRYRAADIQSWIEQQVEDP